MFKSDWSNDFIMLCDMISYIISYHIIFYYLRAPPLLPIRPLLPTIRIGAWDPGPWSLGPGSLGPRTWHLGPASWGQGPGTWRVGPATCGQGLAS